MKNNSLLKTNPYLKNVKLRDDMILQSIISSTAIEGVHIRPAKQKTKQAKKQC
jgi:hypothetical protein